MGISIESSRKLILLSNLRRPETALFICFPLSLSALLPSLAAPSGSDDVELISKAEMMSALSKAIASTQQEFGCVFDSQNIQILAAAISTNEAKILELRSSGIRFRCVTDINQTNLTQCKELMKHFDLFHSPRLVGSFWITDRREYFGYLADKDGVSRLLRVTNPSFVESQAFLMSAVVDRAVPAKQRLVEIVRGVDNEFIETIRDPAKTKSLVTELIDSAIYEIAILFSTRNSFIIAEREGILDRLGDASKRGIKVKILVMKDETVKVISDNKLKTPYEDIQVNYLQQFLPTKITTIIIDQGRSLTMEVNDDTKETFHEAIGLATYSNSESTVFSNASIFESLWIQSELDKQNNARQAYFQLFKGFKLKDEVYDRRWSKGRTGADGDASVGT